VFLVAMPLCLGIAMASGAPLFSGLISGIIGGVVVGALSKSPLGESNMNPYDKIASMMGKKMGVKSPFKKGDSRTNTVKQNEVDENAQLSPSFSLPTLDQYEKACKHVPDHPLTTKKKKVNEGEELRDDNALKDVKAKEALGDLGIAFKFKPGKSGKDRVFITDPMKVVLDKITQGEWEDYGKNPENTIRKFEKGGKILAILRK
jgi:hypothetical protein